jgi:hypothetical protein
MGQPDYARAIPKPWIEFQGGQIEMIMAEKISAGWRKFVHRARDLPSSAVVSPDLTANRFEDPAATLVGNHQAEIEVDGSRSRDSSREAVNEPGSHQTACFLGIS